MSGNESRLQAIYQITNREATPVSQTEPLSKIWADDVFNIARMEESLSKNAFKAIKKTVQNGTPLDPSTADISRTFPVSGKFSPEQREIYQAVLTAQNAVIKAIRPGVCWNKLQAIAARTITKKLLELKILKGSIL